MASKCMRGTFKRKKSSLICQQKGKEQKIYLVAAFLFPEYISGKPNELSISNNECVFQKHKIKLQVGLCSVIDF